MKQADTIVVNFYGGEHVGGKAAAELADVLKKRGLKAEFVPAYAEELKRIGRIDELQDQYAVTAEHIKRIRSLLGACEAVITSSPILMGEIYALDRDYAAELYTEYCAMKNLDVYVIRNGEDVQPAEKRRDREILLMLTRYKLPLLYYRTGDKLDEICRELNRIRLEGKARG